MKGSKPVVGLALTLALCIGASGILASNEDPRLRAAVRLIDEFQTPGLEAELSGIYPHPIDGELYYVLANRKPPYRSGQKPMLAEKYQGKLLTVSRRGKIVNAVALADEHYGGLVFVDGYAYVAVTNTAEILKADPATGRILRRFTLPSQVGGLEYDTDRGVLIAHLYIGHPQLTLVDIKTGAISGTRWADESTTGLAKVDGDWLSTWASGWESGSFSELRIIDQISGRIRSRIRMDGVHSALAAARTPFGEPAFISLVTVDSNSGETVIRKYAYVGERNW